MPEPYLANRRNAPLLAEPPRRVAWHTTLNLALEAITFPGLIVGVGVWMLVVQIDKGDAFKMPGVIFMFVALLGIATIIGYWASEEPRREYRLLRDGRVIYGEVVSFSVDSSTGFTEGADGTAGSPWVQVTVTMDYMFHTPDGARLTDQVRKVYATAYTGPEVRPGDPMAVLYLDEKLYRVL